MKYIELWCNNDNNDNIRAGAKFDAGCGAETTNSGLMATILTTYKIEGFISTSRYLQKGEYKRCFTSSLKDYIIYK